MFKEFAIILICISLIVILYYLYQVNLDNRINFFNNIPFPSDRYANAIGKYCPEGYSYMGIVDNKDSCKSINDTDTTISFNKFQNEEWPTNDNDPGLVDRCDKQKINNWNWPTLSNACYNIG